MSTPKAPSPQQLQALQRVELLVHVPPVPFSFVRGSTSGGPGATVYVQPSAGISVGAGIGINVAANLAFAAIDYAMSGTTREAQGPVSKSVEDLDLAQTAAAQLLALRGNATGVALVPGQTEFPRLAPGNDGGQSWVELAKTSQSDAMLLVRVAPAFRDIRVWMDIEARLITRAGDTLLVSRTQFAGPDHPDASRADIVKWWADGRYRRWLRQGVQAAMWQVAQGLWQPAPADDAQEHLDAQVRRLPLLTEAGEKLRSTACAVESDGVPIVYRYERQRYRFNAAALCVSEAAQRATENDVPGISWFSAPPPPLVEAVVFHP